MLVPNYGCCQEPEEEDPCLKFDNAQAWNRFVGNATEYKIDVKLEGQLQVISFTKLSPPCRHYGAVSDPVTACCAAGAGDCTFIHGSNENGNGAGGLIKETVQQSVGNHSSEVFTLARTPYGGDLYTWGSFEFTCSGEPVDPIIAAKPSIRMWWDTTDPLINSGLSVGWGAVNTLIGPGANFWADPPLGGPTNGGVYGFENGPYYPTPVEARSSREPEVAFLEPRWSNATAWWNWTPILGFSGDVTRVPQEFCPEMDVELAPWLNVQAKMWVGTRVREEGSGTPGNFKEGVCGMLNLCIAVVYNWSDFWREDGCPPTTAISLPAPQTLPTGPWPGGSVQDPKTTSQVYWFYARYNGQNSLMEWLSSAQWKHRGVGLWNRNEPFEPGNVQHYIQNTAYEIKFFEPVSCNPGSCTPCTDVTRTEGGFNWDFVVRTYYAPWGPFYPSDTGFTEPFGHVMWKDPSFEFTFTHVPPTP